MKEKMKLCPVCGEDKAELMNAKFGFIVKCKKCGFKTDVYPSGKEAFEKWNNRPTEAVLENELNRYKNYVAALEEELKTVRRALEFYAGDNFLVQDGKILECKGKGDLTFSLQPIGTEAREALKYE